jgi:WD40 repeat protein
MRARKVEEVKTLATGLWRRLRPLIPAAVAGLFVAVCLWYWWPYQPRRTLTLAGPCQRLVFSPDGRHLASLSDINRDFNLGLEVWDLTTGEKLPTPADEIPGDLASALAFGPDGQTVAGVFADHVLLWHVRTGIEREKLDRRDGQVDVLFTPDGTLVAVQYDEVNNHAINHRTGKEIAKLDVRLGDGTNTDFRYGVVGPDQKMLRIWHWASGQWNRQVPRPADKPYWLAISHDGQTLVAAVMIDTPWSTPVHGNFVHVWDGTTWQARFPVPVVVPSMSVSPEGRLLAVWGPGTPRPQTTWWDHVCRWLGLRRTESLQRGDLKLFDLRDNREVTTMPDVHTAGFSPDGNTLVVAQENQLHVHDLPLHKPLVKIAGISLAVSLLTLLALKGIARLRRKRSRGKRDACELRP